jgi:hypothetical protein
VTSFRKTLVGFSFFNRFTLKKFLKISGAQAGLVDANINRQTEKKMLVLDDFQNKIFRR